MDKLINDGGPAFPRAVHDNYDIVNGKISPQEGMTLRDWFAGQAVAGLLSGNWEMNSRDAASDAYDVADEMMKAREAKR